MSLRACRIQRQLNKKEDYIKIGQNGLCVTVSIDAKSPGMKGHGTYVEMLIYV